MKSLSLCIVMVMAGVFYSSTVLGEGFFDKLEEMIDRVTDSIADKAGERLSESSDKAIDSTMDRTDEVVCDAITDDECKKSKSSPPHCQRSLCPTRESPRSLWTAIAATRLSFYRIHLKHNGVYGNRCGVFERCSGTRETDSNYRTSHFSSRIGLKYNGV